MGRLDDKVAVISGASSGIGRATMELFGQEGATVVGTARREDLLNEALANAGGKGKVVPADLEDPSTADKVAQAALDEYGRIDILVNNAGVGWQYGIDNPGTMAGVHEASLDNWRDIIGGGRGAIVSVASIARVPGLYDAHAYGAEEGALVNLSRGLGIMYVKNG